MDFEHNIISRYNIIIVVFVVNKGHYLIYIYFKKKIILLYIIQLINVA